MKLGDIIFYIGEDERQIKKFDKFTLIVMYEKSNLIGVQLYGSDDEDGFFIRLKSNFITIKEFRKNKLVKLNKIYEH